MATYSVDLNLGGDFAKQAKLAAKALEDIVTQEQVVNAIAKKLGKTNKEVANALKKSDNDREKQAKKRSNEESAFRDKIKAGAAAFYLIKDGALAAARGIADMGKELLLAAEKASQNRKGAAAMINAYTDGRGSKVLAELADLAGKLGESVDDVNNKFVQFRRAGLSGRLSADLIKTEADLRAIGLSADDAAVEVGKVSSAGRDWRSAQRELGRIQYHYKLIGTGADAAAKATYSYEAAQNKLHDRVNDVLATAWTKLEKPIGMAAHRVEQFVEKLLESKEGKEAIDSITKAFSDFADSINDDSIMSTLVAIKDVAEGIAKAFQITGEALGYVASKAKDAFDYMADPSKNLVNDLNSGIAKEADYQITSVMDGFKKGYKDAADAGAGIGERVKKGFTGALKIQSPSKVFEGYGKQTVAGFVRGEDKAIGSEDMPLQQRAAEAPVSNVVELRQPQSPRAVASGETKITIENLNVQGGGTASDNARAIRQELQLLLTANALSRGAA